MKLIECYIENFGTLSGVRIKFNEGINSFVYENGYGKTTITVFIKAMLYGLSDTKKTDLSENDRRHYLPWSKGAFGGWLSFRANEKEYRIERSFGAKAQDDTFRLYDLKTERISDDFSENLGRELFGIDKDGFERTVFLSERNLSGKNENKSISEKLSDTSGTEYDIGAMDEALKLLEERRKFYYKRGGSGSIADAEGRLNAAKRELLRLEDLRQSYDRLCRELSRLEDEKAFLDAERSKAESELILQGKREEAEKQRKEYEERLVQRKIKLERLSALDDFFKNGIPTAEELDDAYRAWLRTDEADYDEYTESEELTELKKRLSPVSHEQLLHAKELAKGGGNTGRIIGFTVSALLAVFGVAMLFFITSLGFASIVLGAFSLILTIIVCKNPNKSQIELVLHKLSVFEFNSASDELDRLSKEYSRLELLSLSEEKRKAEYLEKQTRHERDRIFVNDFLSRFNTIGAHPFDEIRAALSERTILSKELSVAIKDAPETFSYEPSDTVNPKIRLDDINAALHTLSTSISSHVSEISAIERELDNEDTLKAESEGWREKSELYKKNYFYIQKAKEYLEAARDNMTSKYLGGAKRAFLEYMKLIDDTEGEYMLNTDFEVSKAEYGAARSSEEFSLGTRSLQYLATRLALTDALFEGEAPFLIFDDPFISFDDAHTKRAAEVLRRIAEQRQIIYFTCSESRKI